MKESIELGTLGFVPKRPNRIELELFWKTNNHYPFAIKITIYRNINIKIDYKTYNDTTLNY